MQYYVASLARLELVVCEQLLMVLVLFQEHVDEVIVEVKRFYFSPQVCLDVLVDLGAANKVSEDVWPLYEGIRGGLGLEVFLETEV